MVNNRLLPIASAYNFRDLGGYLSQDGRIVKWNTFIRSGDFPSLSDEDNVYLQSIPIKSVVDFRAKDEEERLKDTIIPNSKSYFLSVDSGNLVPEFMALMNDKVNTPDVVYSRGVELMKTMYLSIVTDFRHIYKEFFKLIQNQEVPILFHCTAGKDRTGIAAALLLSALNVDRDVILKDYLMTNELLVGKYANLGQYGPLVDFFQTVRPDYLYAAFDLIERKFGGMNAYLTNELGVDIKLMQDLYLESK